MIKTNLKDIDDMTKEERKVNLPFGLNGELDGCEPFSSDSIFGAENSGNLKGFKKPVLKKIVVKKK